jgi:hypothetical protein
MLAKIPPLHLPPPPLTLTIRPAREVHILKGNEPLAIAVEVKNTSAQAVVVERRPTDLNYGDKHMAGGIPGGGRGGKYKEDFATLKPGQSITWDQKDAPSLENAIEPRSLEGLHYKLIWCSAGSQFGLRAWRGQIVSNEINVAVKAKAEE